MNYRSTTCTDLVPKEQAFDFAQWLKIKENSEICIKTTPKEGYFRFKTNEELWEQFLEETK